MKVTTRAIINVEEEFRVLTRNLQETLDVQDEKLQHLEVITITLFFYDYFYYLLEGVFQIYLLM